MRAFRLHSKILGRRNAVVNGNFARMILRTPKRKKKGLVISRAVSRPQKGDPSRHDPKGTLRSCLEKEKTAEGRVAIDAVSREVIARAKKKLV